MLGTLNFLNTLLQYYGKDWPFIKVGACVTGRVTLKCCSPNDDDYIL